MPNAYTRTQVVELTEVERAELTAMARSRSLPAALALRAPYRAGLRGSRNGEHGSGQGAGYRSQHGEKVARALRTRSDLRAV